MHLARSAAVRIARNARGSLLVEYAILVGLFGLVVAAAIAALGLPLLRFYRYAQLVVSGPVP